MKSGGQMLEDFINLNKNERESILRTVEIIIRRMNSKKSGSSAVYKVFLE